MSFSHWLVPLTWGVHVYCCAAPGRVNPAMIRVISVLTEVPLQWVSEGKFNRNRERRQTDSAPSPCTGAVGDKETKETADHEAFNNVIGRDRLHAPSFRKIKQCESNEGTHPCGNERSSDLWIPEYSPHPAALWFDLQLFKLHICRYIDKKICKDTQSGGISMPRRIPILFSRVHLVRDVVF